MADTLSLKRGALKHGYFESEAARTAYKKYSDLPLGESNDETPEQREALCELIDAVNCQTIYLSYDGKYVSKEEAKKYVLEY